MTQKNMKFESKHKTKEEQTHLQPARLGAAVGAAAVAAVVGGGGAVVAVVAVVVVDGSARDAGVPPAVELRLHNIIT